jgi:hypothetical protein
VINELIAIIIRSIQYFKSPDVKIEHYFFIYQNLLILKNHFRESLEEELAENAKKVKLEESKKNKQKMFNFTEMKEEDEVFEAFGEPEIEEGGLSQYLWETFKYWFTYDYQEVKENSLKIIEDELKNLAWNIKEQMNKDVDFKADSNENMLFLDKLRVYVESIETSNPGQDLNYLFYYCNSSASS